MGDVPIATAASDVTLARLDEQLEWYDKQAALNQRRFKLFKVVGIVAAALIPVLSGLPVPVGVPGALGALVVVLEGIQQLNQFHANWIAYRATCESLKHEKFLYLARAAHYASAPAPSALLAERIESLVSQEHAKWSTTQQTLQVVKTTAGA